MQYITFPSLNI